MKLNKITEWIKKQITRPKKDKGQVSQEPEQQEEIKERIVADCTVNVDALAEARAKLGQAGYTIGEKKEKQKELSMSNNRRKMKGIPMIRQQQLRRAQRNRRKKTNGWQQLGERKYWNQEENAWYTHKQ